MGGHMAVNLAGEHDVKAFDMSAAAVESVVGRASDKAAAAVSVAEAATSSDVIVTMLPSSPHVKEVYMGDGGILDNAAENTLLIDCSTIDPNAAREVAAAAVERNMRFVDAPVSGGVVAAEAGTLTFMVGTDSTTDFTSAKEYLDLMGANIRHCGGPGMGQVAKLCNNLILGISMCGVAEAYNMGIGLGIDPSVLAEIVNTSSGRCWSSDTYNPVPGVQEGVPSANNYAGGFGNTLMLKDLGLAIDAAKSVNASSVMGESAQSLYKTLSEMDEFKHLDFGSVFKYVTDKREE